MKEPIKELARRTVVEAFRPEPIRQLLLRAIHLSKFRLWCRSHRCPSFSDRDAYYQAVRDALPHDAVDYLEFGVYQGGSLRWWLERLRNPESRFYGFDTFTGLPEDWTADKPRGTFSTGGQLPEIHDPRCEFLVGLFQRTLPPFLGRGGARRPWVVHLDADLYSSTLFVLLSLAPHLAPGDILMFDEFQDYMDEYRAFEQYCDLWQPPFQVLAQNGAYTQVAVRLLEVATSA